jgi:hypothetical protein
MTLRFGTLYRCKAEGRKLMAEPLQREVGELRQEITQLRYAIQKIDTCPHRANCPVVDGLQQHANLNL